MRELPLPHQREQQTTFQKGVELRRQLEMLNDDKLCWRVIAEFWAETILYVAPSDNAEAHIEHLAKGGEFVTHLWALLSNAGILKLATGEWHPLPASTTTEGPPTHQLTEALSSCIDEASTSSMSFLPRQTLEPPTNEKGNQLLEDHDQ
ncbi:uncharacterized protein [Miscanthus floridulus]|uniref:uncharacterized protein n=1 Tax=Miscanthus floridulus TaxID=154761 RepID=UPI0034587D77